MIVPASGACTPETILRSVDDRRKQHNFLLRLFAIAQERDSYVHCCAALLPGKLLDGACHTAVLNSRQRLRQRIEAVYLYALQVTRFHRLQSTKCHVVVGADDHLRWLTEARETGFGHRKRLIALEIRGLFENDRELVLVSVENRVQALVAVDRRRRSRLALQMEHAGTVGKVGDDLIALCLAPLNIVGAHMSEDAIDTDDAPIDRYHWYFGAHCLLHCRRQSVPVEGANDDSIHVLRNTCFDITRLLGGTVLPVRIYQRDATQLAGLATSCFCM
jgi:hypothetical protein